MTRSEYQELVEFLGGRFDRIDARFEQMEERLDRMDERFAPIDNARVGGLEAAG